MTEAAAILAIAIAAALGAATPEAGVASQYSPNVMQRVVSNRQRMGHLPDPLPAVDGFIAVAC